jgi:hypothetical protein
MKVTTISRLLAAGTIGIFYGAYCEECTRKWHSAGLQAYLASETRSFEMSYANPSPAVWDFFLWLVVALILFALYEGLAAAISQVISSITGKAMPWDD